jgi:hypothetical protein
VRLSANRNQRSAAIEEKPALKSTFSSPRASPSKKRTSAEALAAKVALQKIGLAKLKRDPKLKRAFKYRRAVSDLEDAGIWDGIVGQLEKAGFLLDEYAGLWSREYACLVREDTTIAQEVRECVSHIIAESSSAAHEREVSKAAAGIVSTPTRVRSAPSQDAAQLKLRDLEDTISELDVIIAAGGGKYCPEVIEKMRVARDDRGRTNAKLAKLAKEQKRMALLRLSKRKREDKWAEANPAAAAEMRKKTRTQGRQKGARTIEQDFTDLHDVIMALVTPASVANGRRRNDVHYHI